ncbi:MAG: zinc ABC transporter solute-binding protein [Proteobacteria bacterium]|nr:zinc ABC transporter solute-binding protein [Pseudomonadota bacterium]
MPSSSLAASPKLKVFVSILPLKSFVEEIGKDLVEVGVMVRPGASPHTYEPKPKQMVAIVQTKLYFAIGVGFEEVWLDKIAASNPAMEIVNVDHGIEKRAMPTHHRGDKYREEDESNEENEHGRHDGLDPHIWLSPPLVIKQAGTVRDALQKTDPTNRSLYEIHYRQFIKEVSELDRKLKDVFHGKRNLQFLVFHPSWGYFARAYGLKQIAIEIEGKNPKPAQLKELIQHARERDIRIVFVQPQFSARSAKLVARAIKGEVAFVDPLAENWMANLHQVAVKFERALK